MKLVLIASAILATSSRKHTKENHDQNNRPSQKRSRYEEPIITDLLVSMINEQNPALNSRDSFIEHVTKTQPFIDAGVAYEHLIMIFTSRDRLPRMLSPDFDDVTYVMSKQQISSCDTALNFLAENHSMTFEVLIHLAGNQSMCRFIDRYLFKPSVKKSAVNQTLIEAASYNVAIEELVATKTFSPKNQNELLEFLSEKLGEIPEDKKAYIWEKTVLRLREELKGALPTVVLDRVKLNNRVYFCPHADDLDFMLDFLKSEINYFNISYLFQMIKDKNQMLASFLFRLDNLKQVVLFRLAKLQQANQSLLVSMINGRNPALNSRDSFIYHVMTMGIFIDAEIAYENLISLFVTSGQLPSLLSPDFDDVTYVLLNKKFTSCEPALRFLAKNHSMTFEVLIRLVGNQSLCMFIYSKLSTIQSKSKDGLTILAETANQACVEAEIRNWDMIKKEVLKKKELLLNFLAEKCGKIEEEKQDYFWDYSVELFIRVTRVALPTLLLDNFKKDQSPPCVPGTDHRRFCGYVDDLDFVLDLMVITKNTKKISYIFQTTEDSYKRITSYLFRIQNMQDLVLSRLEKLK